MSQQKISTENLVQIIAIRKDLNMTPDVLATQVAKASMGLVTRCFESSKRFLGRHERSQYEKVIQAWIDHYEQDLIVLEVETAEDIDSYLFLSEFNEIPTHVVRDTKGTFGEDTITCQASGPYNRDNIFDVFDDIIPQAIKDRYKD